MASDRAQKQTGRATLPAPLLVVKADCYQLSAPNFPLSTYDCFYDAFSVSLWLSLALSVIP